MDKTEQIDQRNPANINYYPTEGSTLVDKMHSMKRYISCPQLFGWFTTGRQPTNCTHIDNTELKSLQPTDTGSNQPPAIRNLVQGRPMHTIFLPHNRCVHSVSYSPTLGQIATVGGHGPIKMWQQDGSQLQDFWAPRKNFTSGQWAADSSWFVAGGSDGTATVWSVKGEIMLTLDAHRKSIRSVSGSPGSCSLATGSCDKTVKLWSTKTGQAVHSFKHHGWIMGTCWYDTNLIATASDDRMLRIWDNRSKTPAKSFEHARSIKGAYYSPSQNQLMTIENMDTVKLWSLDTDTVATQLKPYSWSQQFLDSACFSPDGSIVLVGTSHGEILVWPTDTSAEAASIPIHNGLESPWMGQKAVNCLTWPTNNLLVAGSANTRVAVTDLSQVNSSEDQPNISLRKLTDWAARAVNDFFI